MNDLALAALAAHAQQLVVAWREEDLAHGLGQDAAARVEEPWYERALLVEEVMDHAYRHVVCSRVVADLPDLGHILEHRDKAPAWCGIVHGQDGRASRALLVQGRMRLEQVQLGVEQHQLVRSLVGHGQVFAIAGYGQAAAVLAGPHLGHGLQVPEIELGDPALGRQEVRKASVGAEPGRPLQSPVQCKTVQRLESIAIEHGDMLAAGFDHDEQVQHVHALEDRHGFVRQAARRMPYLARGLDVGVRQRRRVAAGASGQRRCGRAFGGGRQADRQHQGRGAACPCNAAGKAIKVHCKDPGKDPWRAPCRWRCLTWCQRCDRPHRPGRAVCSHGH